MENVLTRAIGMHQTGQLSSAARLYQQILAAEQENADALHLLGVLHHQQGEHAKAVEEIGRAVALRPSVPAFHANLAEAYRALGKCDRAAGCCRTALRLAPNYPEAHCNLGLALQGLRRPAEAADHFRRALELKPDFATAHNNLGITLRDLGQLEEALVHLRRAVDLDPQSHSALTNLGQLLLERGLAEEALPHCREAARLQPDLAAPASQPGQLSAWAETVHAGQGRLSGGTAPGLQPGPDARPPGDWSCSKKAVSVRLSPG